MSGTDDVIKLDILYGVKIPPAETCMKWQTVELGTSFKGHLGHISRLIWEANLRTLRDSGKWLGDMDDYYKAYFSKKLKRKQKRRRLP